MKKDRGFSRILDNDSLVRILSVIVAVIVWLTITITMYPNSQVAISNIPVNFDLTNTTPAAYNLSVIEGMDQTVTIKLEGKRYKIVNLTKDDFIATPTLTQVNKAGDYQIKVEVRKINESDEDYYITSQPQPINVKFDQLVDEMFLLEASAENIVAETGYIRDDAFVSPDIITLKGPKTEMEKVEKCVVETDVKETVSATTVVEGKLVFYDEGNNPITLKNITYAQELYEITVPVNKLKTVPITFKYINVPQGIDTDKLNYTVTTSEINIAGVNKTIDEITEISLGEVDYRLIDIGYAPEMQVDMPAGVINVDNLHSVVVDFSENELTSAQFTIPKANILIRNLPSSYTIKIETATINGVKIVGNADDVEKLTAKDLVAYIDFGGKEIVEGSSKQTIQIYATGNKFAWAVGEYRIVINATKKATS